MTELGVTTGSHGWERVGAISGFVFVALFFIAFFGLQDLDFPPAGSATSEQIRSFFERERVRMALSTVSYAAAWSAFLWFIGGMRSPDTATDSVRRLEGVAICAGVLVAGLALAGVALQSEILLADPTTDDATLVSQLALFDAAGGFFGITPIPRAAFVGALSIVALREGGLRRWLGYFGLLVAAINVLGGIDYVIPADWSLTGHPLLDLIAFLGWILAASVVLVTRRRHAQRGIRPGPPRRRLAHVRSEGPDDGGNAVLTTETTSRGDA